MTEHTQTQPRRYLPPEIPLAVIRRFVRRLVAEFPAQQVILFGSFAKGGASVDSDVDLLVVMPTSNEMRQAIQITLALEAPFPLDLIVRTPEHLARGLREDDWFLRDIMATGKVLYAKSNRAVGPKGRSRLARSTNARPKRIAAQ